MFPCLYMTNEKQKKEKGLNKKNILEKLQLFDLV